MIPQGAAVDAFRWIQQLHASVHDHALPIEHAMHLVHLQRHPGLVHQHGQFRAMRGAQVQPFAIGYVMQRLDVHTLLVCIRQSAHAMRAEQRLALIGRERTNRNRHVEVTSREKQSARCGTYNRSPWHAFSRKNVVQRASIRRSFTTSRT